MLRSLGLGLITGAADDDCAAVGTYAQAGAHFGYSLLWTAPLTLPMTIAAVYLSAKMGQVTGEGLFSVLRMHAPRWLLMLVLAGVIVGNIIEAGADIGGMAAAIHLLLPVPQWAILLGVTTGALALQIWGSYTFIRNVLRVLAMSLLAYVVSALLSHPNWTEVLKSTLIPHMHFNRETLAMVEAIIGASISAYIFTWQSNEEVEEKIARGRRTVRQRRGSTRERLRHTLWDVAFGMVFANDVCQAAGWRTGLSLKPTEAKLFYFAITLFTFAAMVLNFLGINPMRALVFAGIVQGFSTPPLMVLIMVMTNRRSIMGDRTNRRAMNILGWGTTLVISTASLCLIASYIVH